MRFIQIASPVNFSERKNKLHTKYPQAFDYLDFINCKSLYYEDGMKIVPSLKSLESTNTFKTFWVLSYFHQKTYDSLD